MLRTEWSGAASAEVAGIGPLEPPWPDVQRIAVLRSGGLGDLLFVMPAAEALAATYPDAEIVLLGAPLHAALLERRPGPVSKVFTLPPAKGLYEPPGQPVDDAVQETFFRQVRREPVDLAVQLHGGGRWSNPFLYRLEPQWTVGACAEGAAPLSRSLPFRYYQHEVIRALEVVGLAGAPPVVLEPRIAVVQRDLDVAEVVLHGLPQPLLAVHPGATDPRRRWPPERFAQIAATYAERGAGVIVVGSRSERELVHHVTELARRRLPEHGAQTVRMLAELDISGLCGVLARSRVLVANDSGPRHLAAAVGTPTVGVYWMGNVINASPLGRYWHRILISGTATCPVCGVDCTRDDLPRCEHDVSFVAQVTTDSVLQEVDDLFG